MKITVKGRHLIKGLPESVEISDKDMYDFLHDSVMEIVDKIKEVFEQTPPELVGDILTNGIVLTGGGAMLKGFTEIDFTDYDAAIGPCVMMMFTAFTGNITNGLGAGIIVHVLVKLVRGKAKEIHPIMYLLCALMVLYFIVG